MSLSRFVGFGNRLGNREDPLDALFSDSFLFPSLSSAWTLSSFPDHPGFARDVAAVANTQVDWKETADSHIFKANLPGKENAHALTMIHQFCRIDMASSYGSSG
jgi:HSP20 family protein